MGTDSLGASSGVCSVHQDVSLTWREKVGVGKRLSTAMLSLLPWEGLTLLVGVQGSSAWQEHGDNIPTPKCRSVAR